MSHTINITCPFHWRERAAVGIHSPFANDRRFASSAWTQYQNLIANGTPVPAWPEWLAAKLAQGQRIGNAVLTEGNKVTATATLSATGGFKRTSGTIYGLSPKGDAAAATYAKNQPTAKRRATTPATGRELVAPTADKWNGAYSKAEPASTCAA